MLISDPPSAPSITQLLEVQDAGTFTAVLIVGRCKILPHGVKGGASRLSTRLLSPLSPFYLATRITDMLEYPFLWRSHLRAGCTLKTFREL